MTVLPIGAKLQSVRSPGSTANIEAQHAALRPPSRATTPAIGAHYDGSIRVGGTTVQRASQAAPQGRQALRAKATFAAKPPMEVQGSGLPWFDDEGQVHLEPAVVVDESQEAEVAPPPNSEEVVPQ